MFAMSYLLLVLVSCHLDVSWSRPTEEHVERQIIMEVPVETQVITLKPSKESLKSEEPKKDKTRDIIEKIKQINQNLRKPPRKQYYSYQKYQAPVYSYGQENYPFIPHLYEKSIHENSFAEEEVPIIDETEIKTPNKQPRKLDMKTSNVLPYLLNKHMAYLENEPMIYPSPSLGQEFPLGAAPNYLLVPLSANNDQGFPNSISRNPFLKQFPSIPSFSVPWQWPLAPYFPILIKDPFLAILHGGGLNNIIEYGQAADVCNKANLKSESAEKNTSQDNPEREHDLNSISIETNQIRSRSSRAMRLRRNYVIPERTNKTEKNKFKKSSRIASKKPTKLLSESTTPDYNKDDDDDDGDLKFTDFGLFGNKKPVAPSPGFFINRLKVRRGGVAIAGPGGVATAGRGGTAIVGPGGLAYTQPGGLAIAGPAARVVALSSEVDLNKLISQIHSNQAEVQDTEDNSVPRKLKLAGGGKVVATGPVVYYNKNDET